MVQATSNMKGTPIPPPARLAPGAWLSAGVQVAEAMTALRIGALLLDVSGTMDGWETDLKSRSGSLGSLRECF